MSGAWIVSQQPHLHSDVFQIAFSLVISVYRASSISQTRGMDVTIKLVPSGHTLRLAAERRNVPRSTIHLHVVATELGTRSKPHRGRLSSLSPTEEGLVVKLLRRYSRRGITLRRLQLKQTIEIIVSRMTPGRRLVLQFKNGSPGSRYIRSFARRHRKIFLFSKPCRHEVCVAF